MFLCAGRRRVIPLGVELAGLTLLRLTVPFKLFFRSFAGHDFGVEKIIMELEVALAGKLRLGRRRLRSPILGEGSRFIGEPFT